MPKEKYSADKSPSGFVLVFASDQFSNLHISMLYRGDERVPLDIFREGFIAKGKNLDVLSHICNNDGAFVSTSYAKAVAKSFSRLPSGDFVFLYEINPIPGAINVPQLLPAAVKAKKLKTGAVKYFGWEREMAVPFKIEPCDIKGAWLVELKQSALVKESPLLSLLPKGGPGTERFIGDYSYIPNPDHVPSGLTYSFSSKGLKITRIAIHGLTTIGLSIDAYCLYSLFQEGQRTGDYKLFCREATRVAGGWAGAMNIGHAFAMYGANLGKPFGPYGLSIGGIVGGVVGGAVGYFSGGELTTMFFDHRDKIFKKIPKKLTIKAAQGELVVDRLGSQLEKVIDKIALGVASVADKIVETEYVEHAAGGETYFEVVRRQKISEIIVRGRPLAPSRPTVASIGSSRGPRTEVATSSSIAKTLVLSSLTPISVFGRLDVKTSVLCSKELQAAEVASALSLDSVSAPSIEFSRVTTDLAHALDRSTSVVPQPQASGVARHTGLLQSTIRDRSTTGPVLFSHHAQSAAVAASSRACSSSVSRAPSTLSTMRFAPDASRLTWPRYPAAATPTSGPCFVSVKFVNGDRHCIARTASDFRQAEFRATSGPGKRG